jgi:hypothetical protein
MAHATELRSDGLGDLSMRRLPRASDLHLKRRLERL